MSGHGSVFSIRTQLLVEECQNRTVTQGTTSIDVNIHALFVSITYNLSRDRCLLGYGLLRLRWHDDGLLDGRAGHRTLGIGRLKEQDSSQLAQ